MARAEPPAARSVWTAAPPGQPQARVRLLGDAIVFACPGMRNTTQRHAATLLDITAEEAAAVMQTAQRVARAVQATFDPPGLTLLQANGREGDQTVFHFHMHVVPRHGNDGIALSWPRKEPGAQVLQGYAQQLRAALGV